ncbi:MAG: type II toxin-antitoxin system Phd/YefM family antitoxin [Geothrix sp.]|nr:type II toxin-antitoxin system Phd/YefM family antitoxin [Geothrix sp.]
MLPRLVPITDMKRQPGKILGELRQDRELMVITEHGKAAGVLMDVASYETLARRAMILEGLSEGERDLAGGRVHAWDEIKADLASWRL